VPGATLQDVTLLSRKKARHRDAFELALTPEGIEIRRPGQSARHLPWDRVTQWELEERRDGVLLTLRGGGSVTPLIVPRWTVDDLDAVLRDVTSPAPVAEDVPVAADVAVSAAVSDPVLEEVVTEAAVLETEAAVPEPEPVPAPVPAPPLRETVGEAVPEGTLVWPDSTPLDDLGDLVWPGEEPDEPGD
jgi:Bacterial PH domain